MSTSLMAQDIVAAQMINGFKALDKLISIARKVYRTYSWTLVYYGGLQFDRNRGQLYICCQFSADRFENIYGPDPVTVLERAHLWFVARLKEEQQEKAPTVWKDEPMPLGWCS